MLDDSIQRLIRHGFDFSAYTYPISSTHDDSVEQIAPDPSQAALVERAIAVRQTLGQSTTLRGR